MSDALLTRFAHAFARRADVPEPSQLTETTLALLSREGSERSTFAEGDGYSEYDSLHRLTPRREMASRLGSDFYARPTHQRWDGRPVVNAHSAPMRGSAGIPSISEASRDVSASIELAKHLLRERLGVDQLPPAEDLPNLVSQVVGGAANRFGLFAGGEGAGRFQDEAGAVDLDGESGHTASQDDMTERRKAGAESRARAALEEARKQCKDCASVQREWDLAECEKVVSEGSTSYYCPTKNEPEYERTEPGTPPEGIEFEKKPQPDSSYSEKYYEVDQDGIRKVCLERYTAARWAISSLGGRSGREYILQVYERCTSESGEGRGTYVVARSDLGTFIRLYTYDESGRPVQESLPNESHYSKPIPEEDLPSFYGEDDCVGCDWCTPPDVMYVEKPWFGWIQVGKPGGVGRFNVLVRLSMLKRKSSGEEYWGDMPWFSRDTKLGFRYRWNPETGKWENVDYPPDAEPELKLPNSPWNLGRTVETRQAPVGEIINCGERCTFRVSDHAQHLTNGDVVYALPPNATLKLMYFVNRVVCKEKVFVTKKLSEDCASACKKMYSSEEDKELAGICSTFCLFPSLKRDTEEWKKVYKLHHRLRIHAEDDEASNAKFEAARKGLELACDKNLTDTSCAFEPFEVSEADEEAYKSALSIGKFGGVCGPGNETSRPSHPVAACCATHDHCYQLNRLSFYEWMAGAMCDRDLDRVCDCDGAAVRCWAAAAKEIMEQEPRDDDWEEGVAFALTAICLFNYINKLHGRCDWNSEIEDELETLLDQYGDLNPTNWPGIASIVAGDSAIIDWEGLKVDAGCKDWASWLTQKYMVWTW